MKVLVKLRIKHGEKLTVGSPILVRVNKGAFVPMTACSMARMDALYSPKLG